MPLLDAPDMEESLIPSTSDVRTLKATHFQHKPLLISNSLQQNQLRMQKMHGNKLKGTKIFKTFLGGHPFSCGEGGAPLQHPTRPPLSQQDTCSVPATLQFPHTTFFPI